MTTHARPGTDEYAPYFGKYIELVPGADPVKALESQQSRTLKLFEGRSDADGNFRYAPGKWTVKEIFGHMSDAERIFTYRALRIARGDRTPLPAFDQDPYVQKSGSDQRSLKSLIEEFASVRGATLSLFRSFDQDAWLQRGTASEKEISVRALAFIVAGHELHHAKILEERYLPAIPR